MHNKATIKKIVMRFMRILAWSIGILLSISIILSLVLMIPSVQTYVVGKATEVLSTKTGSEMSIGGIHLAFPKTIQLEDIYLEDNREDTLFYCQELDINASLLSLLNKKVIINSLEIYGVKGAAFRNHGDSTYNFSHILSAFMNDSDQKVEKRQNSKWQVGFEKITLEEIKLNFSDYQDSIYLNLDLGQLFIEANNADITNLKFDLEEIEISGTSFTMKLPADKNESENPEASPLPFDLSLQKFTANDFSYSMIIGSNELNLNASIEKLEVKPELVAVPDSKIIIESFQAEGINTAIGMINTDTIQDREAINEESITEYTFGNFSWDILVRHAEIADANYKMDLDKNPRLESGMDYSHMEFIDFNVVADSIFFNKNEAGAKVGALALHEISGPSIEHLTGKFFIDNHMFLAENIDFKTNRSQISGKIVLSYPAMALIGSNMDHLGVESKLSGTIHFEDSKPFTGLLINNPYLRHLEKIQINDFTTEGTLDNLSLKNLELAFANDTQIKFNGHLTGSPDKNLNITYSLDTLLSSGEDLKLLLGESSIPENIHLPESIRLSSKGTSNLKATDIKANLATNFGHASMNMVLENDQLSGELDLIEFNVGHLLSDTTFGNLSMTNKINGQIKDFQPRQFNLESKIHSFEWNNNKVEHSSISASLLDEIYRLNVVLKDTSIQVGIEAQYFQKDSVSHIRATLDIDEIELEGLHLLDEYFKSSGNIEFNAEIHSEEEYYSSIALNEIRLERPGKSYLINEVDFNAKVNRDASDFYLNSDILDAALTGNTKLDELDSAFLDHIDLYLSLPDSIISPKDFTFDFNLEMKRPEFFTDFLVPDLEELEIKKCQMRYNDKDDILQAELLIPAVKYQDILLKDLTFIFDTKPDSALADLQVSELILNPFSISKIRIHSMFEKNKAQMSFISRDLKDSLKYQLKYFIDFQDSVYNISIDHKHLMLNYEEWDIPQENLLSIKNNHISSKSAMISRGDQAISLESQNENLLVHFNHFDLTNFTEIFVQDSTIEDLSGEINGSIDLSTVFASKAIESNLKISDLKYGSSPLGDLTSKIKYGGEKPISFDIKLENSENNIHGSGVIETVNNNQNIQSIFEIDVRKANTYQPLFNDFLSNMDGAIQGRLALSGPSSNPELNGTLDFNSFQLNIEPTNTLLNTNGAIQVSNNLLQFNSFFIKDGQENPMNINGEINLKNYSDPSFDLEVFAQDFLLVDSPMEGKEDLEGKLNIGINLIIKGKKSNLQVNNDLKIREGTDIYYQLPGNELELITDEGIVEYVDFDLPKQDTVFVDKSEFIGDSIVSLIEGIDFVTLLDIDPKANFTIVIDPNSGDFTEFNLGGKLRYTFNDTQRGRLDGMLEFEKGFYELSFYGLVKKRFQYEPGSIVNWSGDVMDGALNFSARYTVRTNSIGLVSNEISSYEKQLYNQRLPYDVILKIGNKISEPVITFGLDLPERYRTTYPTLDSKLIFLNQPNMESDRNRQVFALLVGGTFIPEDPSMTEGSGGSNFATTAARNSVNAIMTQQLNNFTGQFIQGLDIDMGLNTFDDYGTGQAQTRTQLDVKVSKNLFNDRVTAEMESHINLDGSVKQMGQQNTAGMTEFAVSYKLTESGNYRIKGFRENAFDIFDGEIQNSGIAFIFIKEFDSFRKNPKSEEIEKEMDSSE
jgi:translocation and assembly module TamB